MAWVMKEGNGSLLKGRAIYSDWRQQTNKQKIELHKTLNNSQ